MQLIAFIAEDAAIGQRRGKLVLRVYAMDLRTFQLSISTAAYIAACQAQPKRIFVHLMLLLVRASPICIFNDVHNFLMLETCVMLTDFHFQRNYSRSGITCRNI